MKSRDETPHGLKAGWLLTPVLCVVCSLDTGDSSVNQSVRNLCPTPAELPLMGEVGSRGGNLVSYTHVHIGRWPWSAGRGIPEGQGGGRSQTGETRAERWREGRTWARCLCWVVVRLVAFTWVRWPALREFQIRKDEDPAPPLTELLYLLSGE